MRAEILDILRCPYCGGRLELVTSSPHERSADETRHGVLACHCCLFPVVEGIPVMHLQPEAVAAREALEAGQPEAAFRALVVPEDEARSARFQRAADSPTVTYRQLVQALGPDFEGRYFLYRFSDPSYVVAAGLLRGVAGKVLGKGGRVIDVCGGSGHLTRPLLGLSARDPVVADLSFAKLWLASRFVAPGCAPVCCDANAPLPFARGAFDLAFCADAFMYVWTKRQLAAEMTRLIDHGGAGAVLITHAHNALVWSPSLGEALSPDGYSELFETLEARLFSEARLLDEVVAGGPLDLSRRDPHDVLESDPALALVAAPSDGVFRQYPLEAGEGRRGEIRVNPLYEVDSGDSEVRLVLRFPGPDYEEEFGDCIRYLPRELTVDRATLEGALKGASSPRVREWLQRRIILDLPERYA